MVRLRQRIQCDQTVRPWNRRCIILLLLKQRGEALQYVGHLPAIVFAEWRQPVVVERGQKVVFIKLRGGFKRLHSRARSSSWRAASEPAIAV